MGSITLQPTATTLSWSITGTTPIRGQWTANGADNPAAIVAWLKHSNGAPDLNWQLTNITTGSTYVASTKFTAASWDAAAGTLDANGFKKITFTLTPTWATPAQNDIIDFQTSATGRWQIETGTVTSGVYQLTPVAVPEPSTIMMAAAVAVVCVLRYFVRGRYGRKQPGKLPAG